MLFCVHMRLGLPHTLDPDAVARLKAQEQERAGQLQRAETWKHIWRVVGQQANISIFDVGSPDELHEILSSLPMFPYSEVTVTPLAPHPSVV